MVQYKQKCMRCRKNYVIITYKERFPVCYECQKQELNQKIRDPKMREFFDIPEEFYKKSMFLRNIKLFYLNYKKLSEKQLDAFKMALEGLKIQNSGLNSAKEGIQKQH